MNERVHIANNLKFIRKTNGISQSDFAAKIGVKRSSVGAYEEARAIPTIETLVVISDLYGASVDDLLKTKITSIFPKETKEKGCKCQRCEKYFRVDLNIPNSLWAQINKGANLLCGRCIMERLENMGDFNSLNVK